MAPSAIWRCPDVTPILFLDHAPALGGAEHSLLQLLGRLDRTRWQPHVAGVPGPMLDAARAIGVDAHPVGFPRLRRSPRALADWRRGAERLASLSRQIAAAIIHTNTVRTAFFGARASRIAGVPFIWHMRDFWLSEERPRWSWPDRLGKRWLSRRAARIVVNSIAVRDALEALGTSKVRVVHNGVDLSRYEPGMDGCPFRVRHGIPLDAPLVGVIGRLRPWKGQTRFLRAMAHVASSTPRARFLVAGGEIFGVPDAYEARLHRLATDLGLGSRVVFTGHLGDVREALAALDVFVHPGDPEGFGLVVAEAMAMQVPVIAFRHGAQQEIVLDGVTGVLTSPGDEKALADGVSALLADPPRRVSLGTAARQRIADHFRIEATVAAIEHLYDDVLSGRADGH